MSVKMYKFYCEICNWKKITDGSDVKDLHEIKRSPIQAGIPKFDADTGKTTTAQPIKQARMFRCTKCGRGVIPRRIGNPQDDIDRANDFKQRKSHEQDWADGREAGDERQSL